MLDLAGFRTRGPEFAAASDARVLAALADAAEQFDSSKFGTSSDRALFLIAAHLLASSPSGREAAVGRGPRDKGGVGTGVITRSVYLTEFERLTSLYCAGFGTTPSVLLPEDL